ncbi:prepilin-type N-terminal cleavage/methylation domain-containing protein [Thalassomonas viridans]|uniref:Prepilin-type N-terminal cleavage/methylation domain-containing protein n=1 Tax=Thalassomonas viridans TaxID=137584 RepID=A0AAE9Z1U7_9GAMM|nr:prepilin-type N-terminal cleavage/methylation domain-containing protein [Thalassomonas viridans]WDE04494.1 prepilin-type N-terminal cleavage/methylation domain-containing protein [Thalassomonas viridans]
MPVSFFSGDKSCNARKSAGFTLIEVIIGIVVLAISFSVIMRVIIPTEQQSADQIHQVKAAELAQSLLAEITGRAFDQNSDMVGGVVRCDDASVTLVTCTDEVNFGTEAGENDRSLFNDVDDYHGYNTKVNASGDSLDSSYDTFTLAVSVSYQGNELGLGNDRLAKRIMITVTTPLGTAVTFTGYKANF